MSTVDDTIEGAIRATRLMEYDTTPDYQVRAQEALMFDETRGRHEAMREFLDDKTFKPGLGTYDKADKARRA